MSLFSDPSIRQQFADAPLSKKILWTAQASALSLVWFICSLMSPDRASASGRWLFKHLGPRMQRTAKIRNNLRRVFPEKNDEQIEALCRETWGSLGAVMAEYPHLETICNNLDELRLEVVSKPGSATSETHQGPIVFVSPHLGNWEVSPAAAVPSQTKRLSVIHTEQDNPLIVGMIQRHRQALGCGFVSKEAGLRPILRLLDDGSAIGIIPDQRFDSGEPVEFFGIPAMTTTNPARLALKYRCPLIPVQVERLQGAHFRVIFHAPITPEDPGADRHTQVLQMTRAINACFESWIQDKPGQWWCTKNRWPKSKKQKSRE